MVGIKVKRFQQKPGHAGTLYCTKSATISIAVVLIITIGCQVVFFIFVVIDFFLLLLPNQKKGYHSQKPYIPENIQNISNWVPFF